MQFSLKNVIQSIVQVFLVYLLIMTLFMYSSQPIPVFNIYDAYFIFLITASVVLFLWPLSKKELYQGYTFNLARKDFIFLGLALVISISYRFNLISSKTLWQDELSEIHLSELKPLEGCSLQQQPPISCILTYSGQKLFGLNEFGVRFHVALLSALTSFLFVLLAYSILGHWIYAILIGIFYSIHPLIVQYGFEVRPYSIGLFIYVLLISWWYFLDERKNKKKYFLEYLKLVSLGVLLLLSLGFQTFIFISLASVILYLVYLVTKNKKYFYQSSSLFFSLMIYAPVQLYILKRASDLNTVNFNYLYRIEKIILLAKEISFRYIFLQTSWLIFLPLIFLILFMYTKRQQKTSLSYEALWFGFFCCLYYILIPIAFYLLVNGTLYLRYSILGWPLIIFFLILVIDSASNAFFGKKALILQSLFFLFVCYAVVQIIINYPPDLRYDARSVITWLRSHVQKNDAVVQICNVQSNKYCFAAIERLDRFNVYWKNDESFPQLSDKTGQLALFDLFYKKKRFENLYIFIETAQDGTFAIKNYSNVQNPDIKIVHVNNEVILVFKGGQERIKQNWFWYLNQIVQNSEPENSYLSELLYQKALLEKNDQDSLKYSSQWIKRDAFRFSRFSDRKIYEEVLSKNHKAN